MTADEAAKAEAESIATRWVPAHMTARQGLVDDIAKAIVTERRLVIEARAERDRLYGMAAEFLDRAQSAEVDRDRLKGERIGAPAGPCPACGAACRVGSIHACPGHSLDALAAARAQARDEALREAADLVHVAAVGADTASGGSTGATVSLCLSLAEQAIRALRKP